MSENLRRLSVDVFISSSKRRMFFQVYACGDLQVINLKTEYNQSTLKA
jgi:hypothetical protein